MSAQHSSESNATVSVDQAAALASLDGQRELLKELAEMFCEDAPIVLEELRKAVEQGDPLEARRAVHSLKGLSATFYAKSTVELADRLECEVASGCLTTLVNGGVEELAESIHSLSLALKDLGLAK